MRDGLDVLVLDQGPIGGGQTARTSAHLASALDDRFYMLEKRFGRRNAKLCYESHAAAIDCRQRSMKRSLFQVTMRMERSSTAGDAACAAAGESTRSSNIRFAIA